MITSWSESSGERNLAAETGRRLAALAERCSSAAAERESCERRKWWLFERWWERSEAVRKVRETTSDMSLRCRFRCSIWALFGLNLLVKRWLAARDKLSGRFISYLSSHGWPLTKTPPVDNYDKSIFFLFVINYDKSINNTYLSIIYLFNYLLILYFLFILNYVYK